MKKLIFAALFIIFAASPPSSVTATNYHETGSLISLAPPVKNYADAPTALRGSGVAVISIKRVVAQARVRVAINRSKAMSRRDRVSGPAGVIRPFMPTQGYDNAQDDIAEALDHIARGISAIDHNLELLIARLDGDSAAVARVAASLEGKSS